MPSKMQSRTIVAVMFAFLAALIFVPNIAYAASNNSFYNGTTTNVSPSVSADGLIERSIYFTDASGQTSNYAYKDNDTTQMNRSVVDIDKYQNLQAVVKITNISSSSVSVNEIMQLPLTYYVSSSGNPDLRATGFTFSSTNAATAVNLNIGGLNGGSGSQPAANAYASYVAAGQSNSEMRSISISGTLAAGETITLTVPLTLTNASSLNLYGTNYAALTQYLLDHGTSYGNPRVSVRFARQVLEQGTNNSILSSNKKYLGVIIRPDGSYYAIPQSEWDKMPTISASDIHVDNILYEDRHSATENDVLYTGGFYYIDLTNVKTAMRDYGYSVHTGNSNKGLYFNLPGWQLAVDNDLTDDVYQEYTYTSVSGRNLHINASESSTDTLNLNDGSISPLYTELRQVVTAHDSTITANQDSWTILDNLDAMVDHSAGQVTPAAGSADARVKVVDQSGAVVLDTATMDAATVAQKSEEISKTPGTYSITYYYYFNGNAAAAGNDYEASKTVTLTVVSDTPAPAPAPTPTPTPTSTSTSEEPSNPASPVKEKKAKKKKAQLPNTGEELLLLPVVVMGASALTAAGFMRRKH